VNGSVTIIPPPSACDDPSAYEGTTSKRVFAYLIDAILVFTVAGAVWLGMGIVGLATFGLLLPLQPLAVALVPLVYHVGLIASPRAATLGMRLFGIRVTDAMTGAPPSLTQVIIQIVAFYGSVALTAWLILIFALFNSRRRTLHDILAGTVVINSEKRL